MACKSTEPATDSTASTEREASSKPARGERPNRGARFAKMDTNNDGKLSVKEVKGPMKENFAKIDTNRDGFISKEEMQNAPKPKKGPRR